MAIITSSTPIGYELPTVSQKLSVNLNRVLTDAGEVDTIHTDSTAAAREGLTRPIAVGSRLFGVIPRMMMLCFERYYSICVCIRLWCCVRTRVLLRLFEWAALWVVLMGGQ